MAQIADMTNLEARLTTLASEVESLGQILQRVHEQSSEEVSRLVDWQDEMDDFTAGLKQASTELSSFSQRWQDATHKEELLEQKEAEMRRREELLESKTAQITKGQELLEQRTADMMKREELLKQKEAEMAEKEADMAKREELLEKRIAAVMEREESSERRKANLDSTSRELQASVKLYNEHDEQVQKQVAILQARADDVTKGEDALEKREDNLKQARQTLHHHQQIVIQLHQSTKEQLDHLRQERDDDRRARADMVTYNDDTGAQLKAEAAKVRGLIDSLKSLKSSIATPLSNCEAALANIKKEVQSLNAFGAEKHDEVASLNNDLAQISKNIEAVDTYRTELLDHQFDVVSAKLANVSEVSRGLDAISTKFQEMHVAEPNATESMNSAAEELRNATETGSKAREALQKVLVRQNTSRFAKRGPLLSSPEKPAPKRRQTRAGSAGAAEVLANVESNELLTNTAQTFGSPTSRRRRPLTPLTGPVTAPRSGVSSPAPNPTSAPTQDLPVNPGTNTIVPQSHENDLEVELLAAAKHVRDVWRQIEFPADWTAEDSAQMLNIFNEAYSRKSGKYHRYWPQQSMDRGSKVNYPYCLTRDMKRHGMTATGVRCSTHKSGDLCLEVFYTTDNPGEYDSEATDKRWRLEKR